MSVAPLLFLPGLVGRMQAYVCSAISQSPTASPTRRTILFFRLLRRMTVVSCPICRIDRVRNSDASASSSTSTMSCDDDAHIRAMMTSEHA